jgi:hypothetical protein
VRQTLAFFHEGDVVPSYEHCTSPYLLVPAVSTTKVVMRSSELTGRERKQRKKLYPACVMVKLKNAGAVLVNVAHQAGLQTEEPFR